MSFKKHGLKAFGLGLLATLSMMALGAASAQASGEFLLLENEVAKTFLEHGITLEAITGGFEAGVRGKLSIAGLGTDIECTGVTPANGLAHRHGLVTGSLLYTGCEVYELGTLTKLSDCEVLDKGGDEKLLLIKTNSIHGLVILHSSETLILVKPATGSVFVEIVLEGKECPVSGTYPVTGSTLLLVASGHAVNLLINPINTPTLITGQEHKLRFGERNATLTGAATVSLNGALVGKAWGAF